ncbi:hypothetical protein LXL04_039181 [Taraxacum kok-saghyz]
MENPEWAEAQMNVISIDLIAKTKKHIEFLKAIDDNGKLYNGPILERAIFRYKYYWLPLLAKHNKFKVIEWPLVVKLDCEWIWHCHRLNPVRYVADCKKVYGRILDPCGVVISSVEGTCKKKTEELWNKMYPKEPYELDFDNCFDNDNDNDIESKLISSASTTYDLVSAVKRQSSFFYQVSREFMKDGIFLEGAVQRYKGFLHLIRRNMESKVENFSVPTYDIDLVWHTHQLHPQSYCNDTVSLLGKVLDHDDNDTKDQRLDVGFAKTTQQWKEVFSSRYWRAGAMYRVHHPPTPTNPIHPFETTLFVEIMVEVIEVRNLSVNHKDSLFLSVSKKPRDDVLFKDKTQFTICTKSTHETQALLFQCEPKGELLFELIDDSPKSLGTCSILLADLDSKLATPKWLEFESGERVPVTLGIVISTTQPSPVQLSLTNSGEQSFDVWATGGMCSGSGGGGCGSGCGGGGGGGGGCRASCGGCRSRCGGGNCSAK